MQVILAKPYYDEGGGGKYIKVTGLNCKCITHPSAKKGCLKIFMLLGTERVKSMRWRIYFIIFYMGSRNY